MLPNLIVSGTMKSVTTNLHHYLSFHPEIFISKPKERYYFNEERNWNEGPEWKEDHFSEEKPVRSEPSVNYSRCHLFKGVPERVHKAVPVVTRIYVLRDPIERAVSHYRQRTIQGVEERPVADSGYRLRDKGLLLYHLHQRKSEGEIVEGDCITVGLKMRRSLNRQMLGCLKR